MTYNCQATQCLRLPNKLMALRATTHYDGCGHDVPFIDAMAAFPHCPKCTHPKQVRLNGGFRPFDPKDAVDVSKLDISKTHNLRAVGMQPTPTGFTLFKMTRQPPQWKEPLPQSPLLILVKSNEPLSSLIRYTPADLIASKVTVFDWLVAGRSMQDLAKLGATMGDLMQMDFNTDCLSKIPDPLSLKTHFNLYIRLQMNRMITGVGELYSLRWKPADLAAILHPTETPIASLRALGFVKQTAPLFRYSQEDWITYFGYDPTTDREVINGTTTATAQLLDLGTSDGFFKTV